MGLQIVLGPSGSGKTTALFERVIKQAEKERNRSFIVVVPEQFSLVTTRALVELSPGGGIMNIDVLSFHRLAHRIFDSAGRGSVSLLDDTGKNLILRRVLKELEGELEVFHIPRGKQGYVSEIKSVLSEFIQYDISEEKILAMADYSAGTHAALSAKLRDIALIYRTFREKMGQRYLTREELLDAALRKADAAPFLDNACIVFDGFTGFTPIQYRFIGKLLELAGDCMVSLDHDGEDGDFFALSDRTIANLTKLAKEKGCEKRIITLYHEKHRRYAQIPELDHLERYLFRRRKAEYRGEGGHIRVFAADHPVTEVSLVCSTIRELVRTGQYTYRETAIVMSSSGVYGRLLKSQARRYGIPLFLDETHGILLNPVIEHLRSAIRVLSENFSYPAVFHYLRGTLSEPDREDVDLAENYVRALNLRGLSAYQKPWTFHTRKLKEEELERINGIREAVLNAFTPLEELIGGSALHTAAFLTDAFESFSCRQGVEEVLSERSEMYRQQGDLHHADEYAQLYGKLTELFGMVRELIPDEEMDLGEYLEILNAGFDEIRIGTVPPGRDVVIAADLTRSRLSGVKVLFFLGANEGLLPAESKKAGILSDMDRNFLEDSFTLAPTARETMATERLYFYMSITKPAEKLFLSYSLADETGKALRVSWFIRSMEKLFPDLQAENISLSQVQERLTSPEDALSRLAAFGRKPEEAGEEDVKTMKRLLRLFRENHRDQEISLIRNAVSYRSDNPSRPLSEAVMKTLYGTEERFSPSRLERFAACAYAHFLMYAMHLREREEYGFEKRDMGSLMHDCLAVASGLMKARGKSFAGLTPEEGEALINETVEEFLESGKHPALTENARSRYAIIRLKRFLSRTFLVLKHQEAAGAFRPAYFEKEFRLGNLIGRIDRVDLAKTGEKLFLSVVDYKSGNRKFDLNRVFYGLDLQLFLYLNGAESIARESFPDSEIVPGGVFYYHIADPTIDAILLKDTEASTVEEAYFRDQRLRGVANADPEALLLFDAALSPGMHSTVVPVNYGKSGTPDAHSHILGGEEFRELTDYVALTARQLTERIYSGEIDRSPVSCSGISPCEFCVFSECCLYETGKRRVVPRQLRKLSQEEIIGEVHRGIHS